MTHVAKRLLRTSVKPIGPARYLYRGLVTASSVFHGAVVFAKQALVATPAFLSLCEEYGDGISVECLPYMPGGAIRIRLGNNIRISGLISIYATRGRNPLLEIGDGVFIGHHTSIAVASHVKIGNYVAIGSNTFITDTEGHNKQPGELRSAWDTPAVESDIAPIVIEDGCWIGRNVAIFHGVRIGAGSVIGYGAVVRSNVPPGSMVVGNPGRPIPTKLFRQDASAAGSKPPLTSRKAQK